MFPETDRSGMRHDRLQQWGPLWGERRRSRFPRIELPQIDPHYLGTVALCTFFVAAATTLVMTRMPTPSQETLESKPEPTARLVPTPIGHALVPTLQISGAAELLREYSLAEKIDCSQVKADGVTGIKAYAEPYIGSARLLQPKRGTEAIAPAFPRSEPLVITDLIRLRSEVRDTLWAINPSSDNGKFSSSLRNLYSLVYDITKDETTLGIRLTQDLSQCETKTVYSQ